MKCSCIDVGSNTIKVSVFEKRGKNWHTTDFLGEQTGLIGYVINDTDGKYLSDEGIDKLLCALENLIAFSEEKDSDRIFAFATASLRGIKNVDYVLKRVYEKFELTLVVLSSEEEAICSLKGLLNEEKCEGIKEGIMIDMGGGSTEIVYFANGFEPIITSLPFGCLSLTNDFVKGVVPTGEEILKIKKFVKKSFGMCSFVKNQRCPVFLIGGTARAAEKVIDSFKNKKGSKIKTNDFENIYERLANEKETLTLIEKLIPKRVHTISTGCIAYSEILKLISPSSISVSDSGVREGYLEKILM